MGEADRPDNAFDDRFSATSAGQIEALNLNRIMILCFVGLAFEGINLFIPNFWANPSLWVGAAYIVVLCLVFLGIVFWNHKTGKLKRYRLVNNTYWILLIIGFFPFLASDAAFGDKPLNCALVGTALICAPLLESRDLRLVFASALIVNLAAVFSVNRPLDSYCVEVVIITAGMYLMSRNLHGRYIKLLKQQETQYSAYLHSQIEQEKLQAALTREKDANVAKSRFLSLMSHDMRTPLNGVIGMAHLAMDDSLPRSEVKRHLGQIDRSSEYLLSLIDDVLTMSKVENGMMQLHPEVYDIDEFIANANSIFSAQCAQKHIRFRIITPDDDSVRWVRIDKLRFNQIFLNLLSNSVKFTPEGGSIDMVIERVWLHDDRIRERITVRDTGVGMSPEFIAHALEPFSQEHDDDRYAGTGLGLSIVKRIVDLMGGTIRIESEPGRGTSVEVELETDIAQPPDSNDQLQPSPRCNLAGKHILVCEDNQINTEIVTMLLENESAVVEHAENGRIGVRKFEDADSGFFDAIIMDVRMPDMDGLEATKAIRSLDRCDARKVPIIALTANALAEDRDSCLAAGMNRHLAKPIQPAVLYEALEEEIEHAQSA